MITSLARSKNAQMTIIGLLYVFVAFIVFAALYSTLHYSIETVTNSSNDTMLNMVLDLSPLLIVLALVITIFIYVTPVTR